MLDCNICYGNKFYYDCNIKKCIKTPICKDYSKSLYRKIPCSYCVSYIFFILSNIKSVFSNNPR